MADDEADYAATVCARLIRFDTSNYGGGQANGERAAAEHVAGLLDGFGVRPTLLERTPGRSNVVARIPGRDPSLPAILVQAHLDVVPADPAGWTFPPFAGEIHDGYVWGRGATDMKDMCATVLTVLRRWQHSGRQPARDVVIAFVADEEDVGADGAQWLVGKHRDLFEGCTAAISESGAFTHRVGDINLYPVATAERGTAHLRITAHGRAGHASRRNADNPVTRLVNALHRITTHRWPIQLTPAVTAFLTETAAALGTAVDLSNVDETLTRLGAATALAENTVRASVTPTMLAAGYKVNVIPATAQAQLDVRTLPDTEADTLATIDELLGDGITREFVAHETAIQAPVTSPWFTAMADALRAEDPSAVVVPYCMGGGTDAKAFSTLGIACYGFAPLWLPAGFPYRAMAHGVDERVPVAGLGFGVRVLDRFLST
jgi:acetylornithine deacetylase/succinyl-diaminopimelate desuccinylase-like protein